MSGTVHNGPVLHPISKFDAVFCCRDEPCGAIAHVLDFNDHCWKFFPVAIELFGDLDLILPILLQQIIIFHLCIIVLLKAGLIGRSDFCNFESFLFCSYRRILKVNNTSGGRQGTIPSCVFVRKPASW